MATSPDFSDADGQRSPAGRPSTDDEDTWEALHPGSAVLSAVICAFPDDFAYSEWTEAGLVVAFAAAAPAAALASLREPGIPFELVEHVGHPLSETKRETAALADQVKEVTGGSVGFSVAAIPKLGVLEITLSRGNDDAMVKRWVRYLTGHTSRSGLGVIVTLVDGSPRAGS
jgi:hypothetical protein